MLPGHQDVFDLLRLFKIKASLWADECLGPQPDRCCLETFLAEN